MFCVVLTSGSVPRFSHDAPLTGVPFSLVCRR